MLFFKAFQEEESEQSHKGKNPTEYLENREERHGQILKSMNRRVWEIKIHTTDQVKP